MVPMYLSLKKFISTQFANIRSHHPQTLQHAYRYRIPNIYLGFLSLVKFYYSERHTPHIVSIEMVLEIHTPEYRRPVSCFNRLLLASVWRIIGGGRGGVLKYPRD